MILKLLIPLGILVSPAVAAAQGNEAALTARLERLADGGNAEAAYHAGMAYLMGINGVAKNPAKAFAYFKKSAEGGDPLGAYKLGCFYDGQGEGVAQDDAELALTHKLVAAKAGYSLAQHDVAKFFYARDEYGQAVEWLTASAKQGYKESLQALASLHSGEGKLPKDLGKSYAYLLLMQGGSLDKAPDHARQMLTELRGKLTPAEKSEADSIVAGWKFKPTILTMHALAGQKSARALIERAAAAPEPEAAKTESTAEITPETAEEPQSPNS